MHSQQQRRQLLLLARRTMLECATSVATVKCANNFIQALSLCVCVVCIVAVTEWHCNILAQIAIGQKRLQDNRTEMANDVVTNFICCYFNAPDCLPVCFFLMSVVLELKVQACEGQAKTNTMKTDRIKQPKTNSKVTVFSRRFNLIFMWP